MINGHMQPGGRKKERGRVEVHGLSDAGRVRAKNEDQFLIAHLSKSLLVAQTSLQLFDQTRLHGGSQGHLLAVADGMGGHRAGEDASAIAVDTVVNYVLNTMPWFFRLEEAHEEDLRDELKAAIVRAQNAVLSLSEGNPERAGMGTTFTMAYILWPTMYTVHVGDSRCYLLRDLELRQITTDHTLAQQQVDNGLLTQDEAEDSNLGHMLLNVIGGDDQGVRADVRRTRLELGDALVLCTDGLTRHVRDEDVAALVGANDSADIACRDLVAAANSAGGEDNITVVVAYFRKTEAQAEPIAAAETAPVHTGAKPPAPPPPARDREPRAPAHP